ncbi:MAG: ferrous iron transport protein B, partial [Nitrospirota bacterium]
MPHCHGQEEGRKKRKRQGARRGDRRTVALVGNPNVGKSVIFGLLTGRYVTVSNYPGTTVEVSQSNLSLDGHEFLLVDTPGVNSLLPMSEDERVTRDILLAERPSAVLQVGDSKNLKRTLSLTIQIAEMGLPLVLDLNMMDEAMDRGISVDIEALKETLGIEVAGTVAPERKGLKELKAALARKEPKVPRLNVEYGPVVEKYIERVARLLPEANISPRSIAAMALSGDESLGPWLRANLDAPRLEAIDRLRTECRDALGRPVGLFINEARLAAAGAIADRVVKRTAATGGTFAQTFGRACMHPFWGTVILLGVLFVLYEFVGVLGADILVGLVEETIFGKYLNPMFERVIGLAIPVAFFRDMLVGEYGLITMALTYAIGIILPITTTFFIAFSVLEDSGYLPRLAIMSNRFFNMIGLSGKAVLPMVLGLGCGTMAVMTTRILESRRERIIATFLLALAVPCAAQLGVIMGMLGALSPLALAIWGGSIVLVLLISGYLASKIVPGERSEFFLEIPPIRVPKLENVVVKTWGRAVWYLREAVPLFMIGTFALFILDKLRVLGLIERFASPVVVGVLGLPPKATEAFLVGFFRRDYGAAGLFAMSKDGLLDPVQTVVSLVTLTLFVPCLAHFLMMIKERGMKLSMTILLVILPLAMLAGGALNWVLRAFNIS